MAFNAKAYTICAPAAFCGAVPTVTDLFKGYVQHLLDAGKHKSADRAEGILLGPNGVANSLGVHRPARDIRPADLVPHLKAIHGRGSIVLANDVRAWVHAAFGWAIASVNSYHEASSGTDWGLTANPVTSIPSNPDAKRARDRYLSREEFHAVWTWLERKGKSIRYRNCAALQLMMATGQRPGEIFSLSAAHYDEAQGTFFWKTSKNGRPHLIPLPEQALLVMDGLKPNKHGLYFPRPDYPNQPCSSEHARSIFRRYFEETGATFFETRDLRRTWKTQAGAAGLSKEIRDRLQNHSLKDVSEKHYDRWSYLPQKIEAMEQWDRFMVDMINYVPLPPRIRIGRAKPLLMLPAPGPEEESE